LWHAVALLGGAARAAVFMSGELFCSLKGDRPDAPFREYESLDVFMNNYTEHTWYLVTINAAIKELTT
jgi:hypothetical protein